MAKILIASNNPGKLLEIQALITPDSGLAQVELILPRQLGLVLDVVEDGETYAANAALKAQAYYRAAPQYTHEPLMILADDSGLEVDALQGAPGVYSARYSPISGATDADRRAYLLSNLSGKPRPWPAHFHCSVALISTQGQLVFAEGDCPGEIIPQERGSNGFGYDPIFYLPAWDRTMAELSMQQKNQLSHRALAVKAALPTLKNWLG
jgi:XTP/dITP diphosphohydrolase